MIYLAEITRPNRADDVHVEFTVRDEAVVFVAQNGFTDDGYRIIGYQAGSGADALRPGSKALLRVLGETAPSETVFDSLADAQAAAAALAPSDGYALIDLEQPLGSAPSLLLAVRPALWRQYHQDEAGNPMYIAARANGWDRTDEDRF